MKSFQFKLQVPPQVGSPVRDTKGKRIGVVRATREMLDEEGHIVTVEVDESSPVIKKLIEGLKPDASMGTAGG